MSLKHAANRFRRTSVDGWDGAQWHTAITRGDFLTNDRFVSDREFGDKLRKFMVSPDQPLPDNISVIRILSDDNTYLVGRQVQDIAVSVYSTVITLRRAFYTGSVYSWTSEVMASGMKSNAVRTLVGTYPCDRENITFAGSKEYPTIKFGDEVVILPSDAVVDTSYEIHIGNKFYEIEEIYSFAGLIYCRCIAKPVT